MIIQNGKTRCQTKESYILNIWHPTATQAVSQFKREAVRNLNNKWARMTALITLSYQQQPTKISKWKLKQYS